MFPTWPAKSEMMKRPKKKDVEHSPQAPEGGAMFAKLVCDKREPVTVNGLFINATYYYYYTVYYDDLRQQCLRVRNVAATLLQRFPLPCDKAWKSGECKFQIFLVFPKKYFKRLVLRNTVVVAVLPSFLRDTLEMRSALETFCLQIICFPAANRKKVLWEHSWVNILISTTNSKIKWTLSC